MDNWIDWIEEQKARSEMAAFVDSHTFRIALACIEQLREDNEEYCRALKLCAKIANCEINSLMEEIRAEKRR